MIAIDDIYFRNFEKPVLKMKAKTEKPTFAEPRKEKLKSLMGQSKEAREKETAERQKVEDEKALEETKKLERKKRIEDTMTSLKLPPGLKPLPEITSEDVSLDTTEATQLILRDGLHGLPGHLTLTRKQTKKYFGEEAKQNFNERAKWYSQHRAVMATSSTSGIDKLYCDNEEENGGIYSVCDYSFAPVRPEFRQRSEKRLPKNRSGVLSPTPFNLSMSPPNLSPLPLHFSSPGIESPSKVMQNDLLSPSTTSIASPLQSNIAPSNKIYDVIETRRSTHVEMLVDQALKKHNFSEFSHRKDINDDDDSVSGATVNTLNMSRSLLLRGSGSSRKNKWTNEAFGLPEDEESFMSDSRLSSLLMNTLNMESDMLHLNTSGAKIGNAGCTDFANAFDEADTDVARPLTPRTKYIEGCFRENLNPRQTRPNLPSTNSVLDQY